MLKHHKKDNYNSRASISKPKQRINFSKLEISYLKLLSRAKEGSRVTKLMTQMCLSSEVSFHLALCHQFHRINRLEMAKSKQQIIIIDTLNKMCIKGSLAFRNFRPLMKEL